MKKMNHINDNTTLYDAQLDPEGEVIHAKMLKIFPKYKPYSKGFYFQSQEFMLNLALDPNFNLSKEEVRILFYCLGKMDYENILLFNSQASAAEELGMKKQQFNRGINKLVEKGFIEKIEKIGLTWKYQVNIDFSWKGKAKNLMYEREQQFSDRIAEAQERKLKVVNGGLG